MPKLGSVTTRTKSRIPTRYRLALVGALGVLTIMLITTAMFYAIEGRQVVTEAKASVEADLGLRDADDAEATHSVQTILLEDDFSVDPEVQPWYNDFQHHVIDVCTKDPQLNTLIRYELSDATVYAELVKCDPDALYWSPSEGTYVYRPRGYVLAYVEMTSQLELIRSMLTAFLGITVLGMLFAAAAGWYFGKHIEEAAESERHFFENASHELKTPLAAIQGYAEGVEAGILEPKQTMPSIVRESERMRTLVEQILGVARLEVGAVELNLLSVEMEDFVQDCLMPFETLAATRHIEVTLDLAPGTIEVDPDVMGHAFENVFSNAIRHAASCMHVRYDGHALYVLNDGNMPKNEDVEHLFDRFYTSEGGSTGIGLALAKEIVEQHGWRIDAKVVDGMMQVAFYIVE